MREEEGGRGWKRGGGRVGEMREREEEGKEGKCTRTRTCTCTCVVCYKIKRSLVQVFRMRTVRRCYVRQAPFPHRGSISYFEEEA